MHCSKGVMTLLEGNLILCPLISLIVVGFPFDSMTSLAKRSWADNNPREWFYFVEKNLISPERNLLT